MAKKAKPPQDDDEVPEEELKGKPNKEKLEEELENLDEEDMKQILQNHEMRLRKIEYHLRLLN